MARKKKDQLTQARQQSDRQQWRILIRNPKFWDHLTLLNDKYLLYLDCAVADQEKFGSITSKRLFQYDELRKRIENEWEIAPIPDWASFFSIGDKPSKAVIDTLEGLYAKNQLDKPVPYSPVRVLRWNAASDFVDLKLDLTRSVDVLMDAVRTAIKPMLRSEGKRNRSDKTDFVRCLILCILTG